MKVKEEREKPGLQVSIKKLPSMASGPTTSWQIEGGAVTVAAATLMLFGHHSPSREEGSSLQGGLVSSSVPAGGGLKPLPGTAEQVTVIAASLVCDRLAAPVGHASCSPSPHPGMVPGMQRAKLGHLSVRNQRGEVTLGLLKAISGLRLLWKPEMKGKFQG